MVSETKQGKTPACLCGVKNSTGNWIAFVDDDCLLAENWVEEAARFALVHPDCGAFGGRVILDWELPLPAFVLNMVTNLLSRIMELIPLDKNKTP